MNVLKSDYPKNTIDDLMNIKVRLDLESQIVGEAIFKLTKDDDYDQRVQVLNEALPEINECSPTPNPNTAGKRRFVRTGLTEQCLSGLGDKFMSTGEIRDALREHHGHTGKNLFSSVYQTLSRLAKSGKIQKKRIAGVTRFRKKGNGK